MMVVNNQIAVFPVAVRTTPYEGVFNASFLNVMYHTVSRDSPKIKVQIIDRTNSTGEKQDEIVVSGKGNTVFAHADSNGNSYTNSR